MSTKFLKNFDPSEWITQSEAARLRGVSRQAINKLVRKGSFNTIEIGGIQFIKRVDVNSFLVQEPGRPPYSMEKKDEKIERILKLLGDCSKEQKRTIFEILRKEFRIHPIEENLNIHAEVILEALNQDAGGLTFRMLRGVIAEAAFKIYVLKNLPGWVDATPPGDLPYDYLISNGSVHIRVQVKLQRSKGQAPMLANQANKLFSQGSYVVETQKTRGGRDIKTGEGTRAYKFGEFDILAVAMQPSTNDWSSFMYIPCDWLIPQEEFPDKLLKFQPVSMGANDFWTNDINQAIARLMAGEKKRLSF